METILITVDCSDMAYARRLAKTLAAGYDGFIVYLQDTETTEETRGDVFITDKYDRAENFPMAGVFLCEKKCDANIQENRCFKYGSVSVIVAAILSAYTKATGKVIRMENDTDCPCIGVVSAAGGTGASTITNGLAQHLTIHEGKKVLVLSLDDFLLSQEDRQQGSFSLRHYLYFLQEGNRERISSCEMFTYRDQYGVMYFTPDAVGNSFFEASKELVAETIYHLKKNWGVDVLLIDIGGKSIWMQEKFLPHCNWLVHIVSPKDTAHGKSMEALDLTFENTCYVSIKKKAGVTNRKRKKKQAGNLR